MSEPTSKDREKAAELVEQWETDDTAGYNGLEDRIASALAAERDELLREIGRAVESRATYL